MSKNQHGYGRRTRKQAVALAVKQGLGITTTLAVGVIGTAAPTHAHQGLHTPAINPSTLPLGSMYHVVDQIGARDLWEQGITGAGVNVAVIDSGTAVVSAMTGADKVVAMADFSAEAGVPEAQYIDTYGHGTHMAGIIAGRTPGANAADAAAHPEWFMGVAPDAGIVSVKAGDNTGAVDLSQIIAAVDWVTEHADELDIRVLNLSFTSDSLQPYMTDPLTHAVERAWHAGIVVVVAAGNDGLGQPRVGVPANDPYMIAVGALTAGANGQFTIPDYATNGNGVRNPDLGAPGTSILSLRAPGSRVDTEHPGGRVGNDLFRGSGSSQAAAVTSGAVALLLQAQPWLTPDQVKAKLRRSADETVVPGFSEIFRGKGLLRIDLAVGTSGNRATQTHPRATGTGSLAASRGTLPAMIYGGVAVVGETTALGDEWVGDEWTGSHWTGGTWDGSHWTGAEWLGSSWESARWTGSHWTGSHWTGVDWAGSHWTGAAWTGSSWTGSHWTGSHWTGSHWTGSHWTGSHWTGSHWTGSHWTGSHWTSSTWG